MAAPVLADFRAQFPELSDSDDATVNAQLAVANLWVDSDQWAPRDYPFAVLYFAAHMILLQSIQASASAAGGSGTTDLFVRQISFGERHVSFAERKEGGTAASSDGPGESLLDQTIYGQLYMQLRSRNIFPIMVI